MFSLHVRWMGSRCSRTGNNIRETWFYWILVFNAKLSFIGRFLNSNRIVMHIKHLRIITTLWIMSCQIVKHSGRKQQRVQIINTTLRNEFPRTYYAGKKLGKSLLNPVLLFAFRIIFEPWMNNYKLIKHSKHRIQKKEYVQYDAGRYFRLWTYSCPKLERNDSDWELSINVRIFGVANRWAATKSIVFI